jgi:hypothetical protein
MRAANMRGRIRDFIDALLSMVGDIGVYFIGIVPQNGCAVKRD